MSGAWAQAFSMVFDPYNIVVMLGASLFGLFVGAVPGLTATPMTERETKLPGLEEAFLKEYPLGRIGTTDDVANAALWLVTDESFLTGQVLQVNGGLTLRRNPSPKEINASMRAASA